MRKLLVPVVLVGSILLVQSPAYAWHRFYMLTLSEKNNRLVLEVDSNCEGATLTITSPALAAPITKKIPSHTGKGRPPTLKHRFTSSLNNKASPQAMFSATCGRRHPLCPERLKRGECPNHRLSVKKNLPVKLLETSRRRELPFGGVPTVRWLTIGLGLLLAGGLLLALGRRRAV